MIHSFLMIGQSNMAGRGFLHEVEPIVNDRIRVLNHGRWAPMIAPINWDDPYAPGISLAESFADAYAKDHDVNVGLIPCANGGTSLFQWQVGSLLFDNALYQCELACRTSTIAGVLWHQGESDCAEEDWPHYEERCTALMQAFRQRLGLEGVPFLVGGMGDFLVDFSDPGIAKNHPHIDRALQAMAEKDPHMAYVSARGLAGNPDNIHFSAAALREFGLRYYDAFRTLEDRDRVFPEKPNMDQAIRPV